MTLPIITTDHAKIKAVIEAKHSLTEPATVLDDNSWQAKATIALAQALTPRVTVKKVEQGWEHQLLNYTEKVIIPKAQDDPFFEALQFQASVEKKDMKHVKALFSTTQELEAYAKTLRKE